MDTVDLYFNEEAHSYKDSRGFNYTSATTVIGKYEEHFDSKGMAKRCSTSRKSRYYGMTVPHILKLWKEMNTTSLVKGNRIHNYLEDKVKLASGYKLVNGMYINDKIYTVNNIEEALAVNHSVGELDLEFFIDNGIADKYPRIFKLITAYVDMGYRIFSEIGVFDIDLLVSGLVDILFINFTSKSFVILDWKTNAQKIIPFDDDRYKWISGYFKKDKLGQVTEQFVKTNTYLKFPLHKYQQSTYIIYSLQLSIYTRLIEKLGFTNVGITLAHIREGLLYKKGDPEVDRIPSLLNKDRTDLITMHYLKDEVDLMMQHHFDTNINNKQATIL